MKIRKIRLVNLNSLGGEHTIDFSESPLAEAGLFAITGSTGSGKSTILDALTLALYGRASRYGDTASPPDMMTRHTGFSIAEVVFSVPQGTFRSSWELRRARNRPDGNLQSPIHQVFDAQGLALTQRIRDTEQLVAELTGLTYSQFVRSVLLAQGDFARFLQSPEKERAALLESLTGTELYSRIGAKAYEHWSQLERSSKDLFHQIETLPILDSEERKNLDNAVSTLEENIKKIDRELISTTTLLEQGRNLQEALEEERHFQREEALLSEELEKFAPQAQRLELHRKTQPATQLLTLLDEQELQKKAADRRLEQGIRVFDLAKQEYQKVQAHYARALSHSLGYEQKRLSQAIEHTKSLQEKTEELQIWFEDHQGDQVLVDSRDRVLHLLATPAELLHRFTNLSRSWQVAEGALLHESLSRVPQNTDELEEVLALIDKGLKRLHEREEKSRDLQKNAADHLDLARKLRSLGDYGHLVQDGKPCPLCGSIDHPSPLRLPPQEEIVRLEERLKTAEFQLTEDRRNLNLGLRSASTLKALGPDLEEFFEKSAQTEKEISDLSQTYGLTTADKVTEVQERIKIYQDSKSQIGDLETQIADTGRIQVDARERVQRYSAKIDSVRHQEPFPEESIDYLHDESKILDTLEKHFEEASKNLQNTQATAEERQNTYHEAEQRVASTRENLDTVVAETGFPSIEELRRAHLLDEEAKSLEETEKSLVTRRTQVQTLRAKAQERVARFRSLGAPEGDRIRKIETKVAEIEKEKDSLIQSRASFLAEIEQDQNYRQKRTPLEIQAQETRTQLGIATRLRDLVGSADGARFRSFAQSMTLDVLLFHANSHLQKLTERYRILRPDPGQLELVIQDLHQAGTQRPAASLSGGETFLASLALALGLSDLAGKNARIDSLFIDEGFGGLDPETLDTALSALETLRQRSKTVGIISHVGLLKERIGVQIQVEKLSGGLSTLRVRGR